MIRVLRPVRDTGLITAQVFEELFAREMGRVFDVRPAPLVAWWASVLGPAAAPHGEDEAARRLAEATGDVDFFCPNYESIPLAARFLALRNRSGARVRLLLIAHAAGAYGMEWALLRPLLAAGDVIVAPSESARATVEFLTPDLSPFVRVVNHPMAPLARVGGQGPPRLVSIGRIAPGKLLHRQVEAMAVLRQRGRALPVMDIAGAVSGDEADGAPHAYARSLAEKVRRLGLGAHVRLVGPVRGEAAKAEFLSRASMLVNLSVTLEESFPKAPVEALGVGLPVLGTEWNGLRDTVGPCGVLVPVVAAGGGAVVDATAEAVADGIERLLDEPPAAEECMARAEGFRPEVVLPLYRAAAEAGLAAAREAGWAVPDAPADDAPAVTPRGLLGLAAPLTHLSWGELHGYYAGSCADGRRGWEGRATDPSPMDRCRVLLYASTRSALERFAGHLHAVEMPEPRAVDAAERAAAGPTLDDRVAAAARGPGMVASRVACLADLRSAGQTGALRAGVEALEAEGRDGPALDFLRAEVELREGDPARAVALCEESLDASPPDEHEYFRLRQLAQAARRAGEPQDALPRLDAWLDRYPDAVESGSIWLERGVTAMRAGDDEWLAGAQHALDRAHLLLGDHPAVLKARAQLRLRRALPV